MRRAVIWVFVCVFLGVVGAAAQSAVELPAAGHPRLWIRESELPMYHAWANDANPVWQTLALMLDEATAVMDDGTLLAGDTGSAGWEEYPVENYAMLFAFGSLVSPNETTRADYAARARELLMHAITAAAQGVGDGPYRDEDFSTSDRSRWFGVGFPLTVDWIYPALTADDKALIYSVFTRWCDENRRAFTTDYNHPEPIGVTNDPVLLADRRAVRWSSNNYYTAHMRNMGMMALAFDAADDASGALAVCLREAMGAWLYVVDDLLRTDAAGGLGPEGFEYSPQSMGYTAEFLLALYTAGYADPVRYGRQVVFDDNPFWEDATFAYLHSLSPAAGQHEWMGGIYLPAWYGSGQQYFMPDHIQMFGSVGVYDRLAGHAERLERIRWIQLHTPPGLEVDLAERLEFEQFANGILYFLLLDPAAAPPADPRPAMPTTFYAPGMRRLLARTGWTEDAEWFTYGLSWNAIDHQSANGNAVEFYRNGEWLTQVRVGYDLDYLASDNQNTLTIENTPPEHLDDYRGMLYRRGSQWLYAASGDPAPPAITYGDGYIAAYGDATPLYNSDYEGSVDVRRATRSVVWLQPDTIVIYDHAITGGSGFKRFNLNLPADAAVEGNMATMISPRGQQFTIHTLLPVDAAITVSRLDDEASGAPAVGQTMQYRYTAEAPNEPAEAYFLHVLIGADAGAALPAITLESADPAAPSVRVGDALVSFAGESIVVSRP